MPSRDVNLFYSAGCWSYVGRTGNSQVINLGSAGCWTQGIVAHEIGKLFGLVSVYSFLLLLLLLLLLLFSLCFKFIVLSARGVYWLLLVLFFFYIFPFFVKICFYLYLYIF